MRITVFLLLAACLQVSAAGYSQGITLRERQAPLEKVFRAIETQSGYTFFFNYEWLRDARPVTLETSSASLDTVLAAVFRGQPFSFEVVGKTIVVRQKDPEPAVLAQVGAAPIDIHGRVVDEKNQPVPGVTVSVKGASEATATDDNGEFTLKSVGGDAVLVFTSANMETLALKLAGKSDLAIHLTSKIAALGGITVEYSTGYQSIPKERATGSFTQPDKEMYNARISTDVISKLEGITSGLVFNKDNNGNTKLQIRSEGTIYANDQPLIVVDNFPYDGNINNINPNDVESVNVLKDAAAASIWGVRAGNGVIVITTKKGRINQPLKVEAVTNYTISQKPDLFYSPDHINSSDYINMEIFLFNNGFYDSKLNDPTYPAVSPVVDLLNSQKNGIISPAYATSQINTLRNLDVRNDLSKYFYRKTSDQQYALIFNGGSNTTSYYFSAGYDKDLATQIGNGYDRITLNSFYTFRPVKKLEILASINYAQSNTNVDNALSEIPANIYPYAQFADSAGVPLSIVSNYRTSYVQTASTNGFLNWQLFPLKERGLYTSTSKNYDTRITTGMKYTFIKGLSGEVKYQYEKSNSPYRAFASQESYYTRSLINRFSILSGGIVTGYNIPVGAIVSLNNTEVTNSNLRGQLNYNKSWKYHELNAIMGSEEREINSNSSGSILYGYDDNTGTSQLVDYIGSFPLNPSGTGTGSIPGSTDESVLIDRFRSYFGNVAYTYRNKYSLSTSGRIDGSNYFGVKTNQKSVPLWSVGAKWDIDQESFYHINWLSYLKLRITYGYSGNLDNAVTAVTTFNSFGNSFITHAPQNIINNIPNPELRWEKTGMLNIGFDFSVKKGILSGSAEYYYKKGVDLMGDEPLDPTTGVTQLRGNFANMNGNGVDLDLASKNIDRAFKWSTHLLVSFDKDRVTRYDLKLPAYNLIGGSGAAIPYVGKPVYGIYSYRWGGLDSTGNPRGYIDHSLSTSYANLVIPTDFNDIVYSGPARPTYFGGLKNAFSYKDFTLLINISFKLGYYFRRSALNYYNLFNSGISNNDFASRWQKPGDESKTNVPSLIYPANQSRDQFYQYSEVTVERADHIRLQDISLGYDLNKEHQHRLFIKSAQIYIYASNLGIIWKANKKGIDPDYLNGSIPSPRMFSVAFKGSF